MRLVPSTMAPLILLAVVCCVEAVVSRGGVCRTTESETGRHTAPVYALSADMKLQGLYSTVDHQRNLMTANIRYSMTANQQVY